MLNLNKRTKTKPKSKPTLIFKNLLCVCAYHCAQPPYTTQHRTIILPLILQTIIAQMTGSVCHKLCKTTVRHWMHSDRNWERLFSYNVERHPATLWRFYDFDAVIRVPRFTYLSLGSMLK